MKPRLIPMGDAALLVQLGEKIDLALNRRVHALDAGLRSRPIPGVIETVPAYASVLVHYDPLMASYDQVSAWVKMELAQVKTTTAATPRRIEVPIRYGGEDGPDLEFVAAQHKLSPREVAEIHAGSEYSVFMMGFTPGFPYMGRLDERIATPRLDTPRKRVVAGSVGIAGVQTGIYPIESPGGWRIIGRTSLQLFDPASDTPFRLAPGDAVRFVIEAIHA